MRVFILVLFSFFSCYTLRAQQIYVCLDFNPETGIPSTNTLKWEVDAFEGSYFYLIYKHTSVIKEPKMYVFIDRLIGEDEAEEYDEKRIFITQQRDWVGVKYTFNTAGKFRIYFLDAEKQTLGVQDIELTYKNKVAFSIELDKAGQPTSTKKVFDLLPTFFGVELYVCIKDIVPFQGNSMSCSIYRYDGSGFNELAYSSSYATDPAWTSTFFKVRVYSKGQYLAVVKKADGSLFGKEQFIIR